MQVPKRSNAVSGVRTPNSLQRFHQNKIEQADAMLSKSSLPDPPHYGKFVASYRISTDRQWPNGLGLAPTRNDSLID